MSEEDTVNPEQPSEGDLRTSMKLRDRGFVGGDSVVYTSHPQFTIADFKAALFESKLNDPKTLPIMIRPEETVRVYVSMARAVFHLIPVPVLMPGQPLGYDEEPDWYFEGWVQEEEVGSSLWSNWPVRGFLVTVPIFESGVAEVSLQPRPVVPCRDGLIIEAEEEGVHDW